MVCVGLSGLSCAWSVNAPRRVGEVHPGALGRALPPALTHRMVSLEESRKLLVLCQRVRREPDDAKLLVFCQTEPQALRAAERLRRALWGIHNVVVREQTPCFPRGRT
jgi:superfamily II DNA/RNA helicase